MLPAQGSPRKERVTIVTNRVIANQNKISLRRRMQRCLPMYLMVLPGLIYLIINNYIPMSGMIIAFKHINWNKGILGSDWAGLSNFEYLFKTKDAWMMIRNTVCYSNLDVKVAPTHAGVSVGPDGGSHQMLEDITLMRVLPNMRVLVPADYAAAASGRGNCLRLRAAGDPQL